MPSHAPPDPPPPAPATFRRAPADHAPRYLATGLLLLAMGGGVLGWLAHGLTSPRLTLGDLLWNVVNPHHPVSADALTPLEWTFAVALLTVAALALRRRRAARGGALLLAFLLLGLCLRQGVGALDERYRLGFETPTYGPWALATYAVGLLVAVAVLALLLPRPERPAGRYQEDGEGRPPALGAAGAVAGAALIVLALVRIGWLLDNQRLAARYDLRTWNEYFRELVDPSLSSSPVSLTGGSPYYEAALPVAMLLVGGLACAGRPVARGAGLTLLGMLGYLQYRALAGVDVNDLDLYFDSGRGTLWLASALGSALAVLAGLLALAGAGRGRPRDRAADPGWSTRPGPPPFPR
ncbi:hypothetical protein RM844_04910 [Streptomyces sp. DSM 44915]|uniref:Uncharacterized protein n=1 Tax=Streptomyces chisholmiae TaxID=3075540 RepID=A0ABU2JN11_9ACTN|nr:hypothetical protein [Streptomyces sp. DSM 44915]MDT0265628.1 hypothetical protein [Streptomyces sp. DSM 44915]